MYGSNHTNEKRIAGISAWPAIVMYGMPVMDAIRNAETPMIGGSSVPPVEATASVAAANGPL